MNDLCRGLRLFAGRMFRSGLTLFLALAAGGCTGISVRPENTYRTLFCVSLGSADDTPERIEENLDEFTSSRSLPGNRVTLLQNGNEAFPEMLAAIDNARCRVSLTTYDLRGDRIGRKFAAALHGALARGVVVRVVFDHVGSQTREPDLFGPLVKDGLQLREFNPPSSWTVLRVNNRSHRKILVADGQTAFLGGLNIGEPYDGDGVTGWRDMALRVDGPAALEAEKVFAQGWNQAGKGFLGKNLPLVGCRWLTRGPELPFLKLFDVEFAPTLCFAPCPAPCSGNTVGAMLPSPGASADGVPVRVVEQSPEWTDSHILNMHLVTINSAKKNVYIVTPYFIPPRALERALINAARRGVDVRILTQEETDQELVRKLSRYSFEELVGKGVKVYGWNRSVLHGKAITVDDRWCSVGSCNLDGRALFLNYEANFAVNDPEISRQVSQQFLKDLSISRQYNLEECRQMRDTARFFWAVVRGQF